MGMVRGQRTGLYEMEVWKSLEMVIRTSAV
jgi:hypothetical protein